MSTDKTIPEFACPHLKAAVSDSHSIFESFQKQFDGISEDIKQLEAYLRSCSIVRPLGYEVSLMTLTKGAAGDYAAVESQWPYPSERQEEIEGKDGQLCIETLIWSNEDVTGNRGKFRIYFETVHANGTISLDKSGKPRLKEIQARSCNRTALIECPIETRIRMKPYLPRFVEHVAQQLSMRTNVYVFEDLLRLEDPGLQELLRWTPRDEFVAALKPLDDEFRQVFLRNVSAKAEKLVRAELESSDSLSEEQVKRAKSQMALRLQRLVESGRLSLL